MATSLSYSNDFGHATTVYDSVLNEEVEERQEEDTHCTKANTSAQKDLEQEKASFKHTLVLVLQMFFQLSLTYYMTFIYFRDNKAQYDRQ